MTMYSVNVCMLGLCDVRLQCMCVTDIVHECMIICLYSCMYIIIYIKYVYMYVCVCVYV